MKKKISKNSKTNYNDHSVWFLCKATLPEQIEAIKEDHELCFWVCDSDNDELSELCKTINEFKQL